MAHPYSECHLGPEKSVGYIEVSVRDRFEDFNVNFDSRHPISTSLIIFQLFTLE